MPNNYNERMGNSVVIPLKYVPGIKGGRIRSYRRKSSFEGTNEGTCLRESTTGRCLKINLDIFLTDIAHRILLFACLGYEYPRAPFRTSKKVHLLRRM